MLNNDDIRRFFADVLKDAQEKGYAEADPTLDINGGDDRLIVVKRAPGILRRLAITLEYTPGSMKRSVGIPEGAGHLIVLCRATGAGLSIQTRSY